MADDPSRYSVTSSNDCSITITTKRRPPFGGTGDGRPILRRRVLMKNLQTVDNKQLDCPICFGPHNDEIHDASISVRTWFRADVLRRMEQPPDLIAYSWPV